MAENPRILVVDDEEAMRHMLTVLLGQEGYDVDVAANGKVALEKVEEEGYDIILADIRMPKMNGKALLKELQKRRIPSTVIMMSAYGNVDAAIEAIKLGAYDYIPKPFKSDEILLTLKKAEERRRLMQENVLLKEEVKREFGFDSILTHDENMLQILRTAKKMAAYKSTVLISGDSGTGKELVAKAIHNASPRAGMPFVAINCGAIPETLLESELFGHTRGAFTDAHRAKKGLFAEADGGTLFLDEVGALPLLLQVKLLRVLQEEEIRRIGDTKPIKVDVRIVAATVRNLDDDVKEGRFRNDLYYRLNVLPIQLPPLQERRADIPLLADYFLDKYSKRAGKPVPDIEKKALETLMDYHWPGNIRELENTIERAVVLSEGEKITVEDLPPVLIGQEERSVSRIVDEEISIKRATRAIEERLIRKALKRTNNNRTQAAKILEISHRALLYKIKEYQVID